ncbi:cupin domain-containing protein, partial [Leclercia adecarboxylata]|uniref:cupin n=1 Tax=Leclercia adecarboxylata TaxID=83655 RepID=UPI00234D3C77
AFRAELARRGCAEPVLVVWEPGRASAEHAHDFIPRGLVLEGGYVLTTASGDRALGPGDDFEVAAGTLHRETAGSAGTRILTGRLAPG